MKLLKTCNVQFRPEAVYVFSYRNTPYGMIANLPSLKLAADVSPEQLGGVLLEQLDLIPFKECDVDLRAATDAYKKHLTDLGFKSVKAFAKNSALVSVLVNGDGVEVEPHEMTAGGAFVPLTEGKKLCAPGESARGRLGGEQREQCKP